MNIKTTVTVCFKFFKTREVVLLFVMPLLFLKTFSAKEIFAKSFTVKKIENHEAIISDPLVNDLLLLTNKNNFLNVQASVFALTNKKQNNINLREFVRLAENILDKSELPNLNLRIDETVEPDRGDPEDFFSRDTNPPDSKQVGKIPFKHSKNKKKDFTVLKKTLLEKNPTTTNSLPWFHTPITRSKIINKFPSLIGFPIIDHSGPLTGERGKSCFLERSGHDWICIEEVIWPLNISAAFETKSLLYKGSKAVTRYRNGKIDRIFSTFHAKQFSLVANYLKAEFGEPSQIKKNPLLRIGEPTVENLSIIWRFKAASNDLKLLEIRAINDSRGLFPDTKHGVFLIYNKSAESIFDTVEISDFMLHQLRKGDPNYTGK